MSVFLLDTNCCIQILSGRVPEVRARFNQLAAAGERLLLSSVSVFELWYGVANSARPERNAAELQEFLAGPVELLEFDEEDARFAGKMRGYLRRIGRPIGPYDLLLAGQALRRGATLVTANISEFSRVPGLMCEDWTSSA